MRVRVDRGVRRNRLSRIVRIPVWPRSSNSTSGTVATVVPTACCGARPRDLEALALEGVGKKGTAAFVAVRDDDVRLAFPKGERTVTDNPSSRDVRDGHTQPFIQRGCPRRQGHHRGCRLRGWPEPGAVDARFHEQHRGHRAHAHLQWMRMSPSAGSSVMASTTCG